MGARGPSRRADTVRTRCKPGVKQEPGPHLADHGHAGAISPSAERGGLADDGDAVARLDPRGEGHEANHHLREHS
jgi:hypothetical protein